MHRNALGECREDDITKLYTVLGNDIAEGQTVCCKECWKVMYQHQQDNKSSIIELLHGICELNLTQVWLEE